MRTPTVFSIASSTIHADLVVVGLKRIGISTAHVSVIYPSYSQPDAVLYWLDGSSRLALSPTGESVTVSGPLRFAMHEPHGENAFPFFVQSLRSLGLTEEQSRSFENALKDERVLVCVQAADDRELALIFHVLHHIGAEKIVIAETEAGDRYRERLHPEYTGHGSKAPLALSAA